VPEEATQRGLDWLDATCPLVSKVHRQAQRQVEAGRHILFVGHNGHPEVIGTMGQVPEGVITLVETVEDVAASIFRRPAAAVPDPDDALGRRYPAHHHRAQGAFPAIVGPRAEDICYATSNRQAAVKAIAPHCQLLVIGAPNSGAPGRSGGARGRPPA
jgi:4-hydroxy-3-methylbut-2-enyl diphosphate reductase